MDICFNIKKYIFNLILLRNLRNCIKKKQMFFTLDLRVVVVLVLIATYLYSYYYAHGGGSFVMHPIIKSTSNCSAVNSYVFIFLLLCSWWWFICYASNNGIVAFIFSCSGKIVSISLRRRIPNCHVIKNQGIGILVADSLDNRHLETCYSIVIRTSEIERPTSETISNRERKMYEQEEIL